MEIDELISEIPIFENKEVFYEPLNGGLSNQTYKITSGDKRYVLRVFGQQTEFLQLTRGSELEVLRVLNKIARSPAVIFSDRSEKYVLLEYIEGRQVTKEDLLDDSEIRQLIVKRMKEIHESEDALQLTARRCSPYHLVESYMQGANQLKVKHPEGLAPLLNKMEKIAYTRSADKRYNNRFCHNDYYLFNLIRSPEDLLHVVDWELSGTGDVFFDLATIPFTNGFTSEQEKGWLQLYFDHFEEEQYTILQDMKFMNMLRECSWGLLHSGLTQESVNHNFDYYKHAEHVIKRLQYGLNFM